MSIEEIDETLDFVEKKDKVSDIMVIGVGGGGSNAINNMFESDVKNVDFVVCNTDAQALYKSKVPTKLLIGPKTTGGKGAGNIPEVGRCAAEESLDDINDLFNKGTKMVFVTAGMGGGTGTGAAPVVAKVAKEKGLLTIGIVTIPFIFEGQTKIEKALDGADEMRKYVDALLVINNERLKEIYPDLTFFNGFKKADDTLTTAARSISELITGDGYINLDFNDVDTTLRSGGAAIISTGYGEGEGRMTKAFEEALNSPLLKNNDIMTAKKLLFNIYFAQETENPFTMKETSEIASFVANINPGVDIIWGSTVDDSLGDKIKITILAAGFEVDLQKEHLDAADVIDFSKQNIFEVSRPTTKPTTSRIMEVYGESSLIESQKHKYVVLNVASMDDDTILEAFEATPTFTREKSVADDIRARIKAAVDGSVSNVEPFSRDTVAGPGQTITFTA